jgi:hypothetical protein
VVLLRAVAGGGSERGLSWRATWRLTLAGVAASGLLATAGAGGIALRPSAALDLEKGGSSPDRRMSEPGVHCYGHADHGRVHLK